MQVTETLNEGLKRGYDIVVTAAELENKVTEKLSEAQPDVEMKGFRKGKVPLALLRKQFGQRLMGEAMQESIDEAMKTHFDESGDKPAMQPAVKMTNEDWKEGDDVHVSMEYEALPPIPEVDMGKLKLERLKVIPAESDVDEALEKLAADAPAFESKKKGTKAKDGDQVMIDFLGKIDGEAFEGGAAEDYPLVLGSNSFIPGFEEQLVGAKTGDETVVEVSFPAEYQAPHLAGKAAQFEVTIKDVLGKVKAKVDDELAKQFGAEDLEALKGQVRERLDAEFTGAARAVAKRGLLDALDKDVAFDLPASLVDAEAGQIAHQLWHDENPEVEGHDHPEIEPTEDHIALANRRVKLGLLLAEIGQVAEVEVTDAEMTQAVMTQARNYPGQERQFFEAVQQNPGLQQQIRAPLFEDKVVDHIFENANVTDKEVSKDDLTKAVESLEEEA